MQRPFHLSVGLMLCCLVTFFCLSLPTTSEAPGAPAGTQEHGREDVPTPDSSYPLTVADEVERMVERHIAAPLALVVAAMVLFGAGVSGMLKTNVRGRGAGCSWGVEERLWSVAAHEGPSFLGVFLL
jgi:hypothetical protein